MANDSYDLDEKNNEIWTTSNIDRLTDEFVVPALWSTSHLTITFGLFNTIFERLQERGKGLNQLTLTNIVKALRPDVEAGKIPRYFNLGKKLKSKRLNLRSPVPWLESNDEIGPICSSKNISMGYLNSTGEPFMGVMTNGVILELRTLWWRKRQQWKVLSSWLNRLGINTDASTEKYLRYKVNAIHDQYIRLEQKNKAEDVAEFKGLPFTLSAVNENSPTGQQPPPGPGNASSIGEQDNVQTQPNNQSEEPGSNTLEELHQQISLLVDQCNASTASENNIRMELKQLKLDLEFCKEKARKMRKNYSRKVKRRDWKITEQQKSIHQLQQNIKGLSEKMEIEEKRARAAQNKVTYLTSKNRQIQSKIHQLKTDISIAKHQVHLKEGEVYELVCKIEEMLSGKLEIRSKVDGRYTDEIRQTVMALGSLGLGSKHISKVIDIVSNGLFSLQIPDLPSETSVRNFLLEANIVGKLQACEALLTEKNTTLHADGTTDHQRHFFAFQLGTVAQNYAMAIAETVHSDAHTQLEQLKETVGDLASLLSKSDEERTLLCNTMLMSIKNLMSDQHVVNKKFKEDFEALREQLLEKSEEKWTEMSQKERDEVVKVHQWFCLLHVLLGLTDATEDATSSYENILTCEGTVPLGRRIGNPESKRDKSAVYEAVKAACALLTPCGHPAAGLSADFRAWMVRKQHKIYFITFQHNRFNVTFQNAAALYHHRHHVQQFLTEVTQSNQLIEAVRGDLNDEVLMACVRGVAVMYVLVTAPFHSLVLDQSIKHIMDLNPYLKEMLTSLEKLSSNPWIIMNQDFEIWDRPPIKNEFYHSIMPATDAEPNLEFTMELISLISTHCLVTFSRQVASQLPGGEHGGNSAQLREEAQTVATSNSIGESQFAYLKFLRFLKPNASTENIEGSVMWAYNQTLTWLQSLQPAKRQQIMESARTNCSDFRSKWSERRQLLNQKRLESLKAKEQQQERKVARQAAGKQKTLDEVDKQGGQCRTEADVDTLMTKHENPKDILLALKAQIRYYKTVINPPGVEKLKLQFSHQGKPYSCEQLEQNLKSVIRSYQSFLESEPSTSSETTIADHGTRSAKLLEKKKEVLCNYQSISQNVSTDNCRKGQKRRGDFPEDPTGKRIRHRWKIPGRKTGKWYSGTVLGICGAEEVPTEKDDVDNNLATNNIYQLFRVSYDNDDLIYKLRIEKDWFRNDLEFEDDER